MNNNYEFAGYIDDSINNHANYTGTGSGGSTPSGGGGMSGGDWLGALINLGGAIYQTESQKSMQRKQNKFNKQEAELAYQREIDMWNLQNAYNDPSAQMARLRAAGLNPNMVYGQSSGGAAGQSSSSSPSYSPAQGNFQAFPININGVIDAYQTVAMRQAQINNVKAQTENINARTMNESWRRILLEMQGKGETADVERKEFYNEYLQGYDATMMHNEARRSQYLVDKEIQNLRLMSQDEVLKNLQQRQSSLNLDTTALQQQKLREEILFKKYENDFRKMGVTGTDHIIFRGISRMLDASGLTDMLGSEIQQIRRR